MIYIKYERWYLMAGMSKKILRGDDIKIYETDEICSYIWKTYIYPGFSDEIRIYSVDSKNKIYLLKKEGPYHQGITIYGNEEIAFKKRYVGGGTKHVVDVNLYNMLESVRKTTSRDNKLSHLGL